MGSLHMRRFAPLAAFTAADLDKTACYGLPWSNTKEDPDLWSQIYNAVVPGEGKSLLVRNPQTRSLTTTNQ